MLTWFLIGEIVDVGTVGRCSISGYDFSSWRNETLHNPFFRWMNIESCSGRINLRRRYGTWQFQWQHWCRWYFRCANCILYSIWSNVFWRWSCVCRLSIDGTWWWWNARIIRKCGHTVINVILVRCTGQTRMSFGALRQRWRLIHCTARNETTVVSICQHHFLFAQFPFTLLNLIYFGLNTFQRIFFLQNKGIEIGNDIVQNKKQKS